MRDQWLADGVLRPDGDGFRLDVHVQPGAKKTESAGLHGGRLKVKLAAPPVDGKANDALIAWVAASLDVPRSQVTLVRGLTSRQKSLHVASGR